MSTLGKMKEIVALNSDKGLTRDRYRLDKIMQKFKEENLAEYDALKNKKGSLKKCQRKRLERLEMLYPFKECKSIYDIKA